MGRRMVTAITLLLVSQALHADEPVFRHSARTEISREALAQLGNPNDGEQLWRAIYRSLPDSLNAWRMPKPTCGPIVVLWSAIDPRALDRPRDESRERAVNARVDSLRRLLSRVRQFELSLLDSVSSAIEHDALMPNSRGSSASDFLAAIDNCKRISGLLNDQLAVLGAQQGAMRRGIVEADSVEHAVLFFRRKYVWEEPTSCGDIVGKNQLLLVIIGRNPKLAEVTLEIRNDKSAFERELGDLINVAKGMKAAREDEETLPVWIMEANPDAILPPSRVAVQWSSGKDSAVLFLKEKVMLGIRVGLSASQVGLKSFRIENQQLVVSGDEAQHADWRSALAVMLEIHMPRDEEAMEPLWGNGVWQGGWDILYNLTLQRLGVVGGIRLSTDPLESWYLGLNYSVTPELGIILGRQGSNQPKDGTYSIGNITSLSEADKFMRRKYAAPKFFMGLSFTPRAIGRALGVLE
jgi:hypothetical protein